MLKIVVSLLLFLSVSSAFAGRCGASPTDNLANIAATSCTNDSLEMIDLLKSQGFQCEPSTAAVVKRGTLCKGKIGSYSQPVRIYVSPNYQKKSPAQINLHFHGHRLNGVDTFQTNTADTRGYGDYGARLVESQSTNLLVIPESTGKCANYDTELNEAAEMKSFTQSLEKVTGLTNANYKLSAHSGGGRILNKTLANGSLDQRVVGVGLFDAIYEDQVGVKKYLKSSGNNKAVITYLENASTQKMTTYFLATAPELKTQVVLNRVSSKEFSHMAIMNQGSFADFLAK